MPQKNQVRSVVLATVFTLGSLTSTAARADKVDTGVTLSEFMDALVDNATSTSSGNNNDTGLGIEAGSNFGGNNKQNNNNKNNNNNNNNNKQNNNNNNNNNGNGNGNNNGGNNSNTNGNNFFPNNNNNNNNNSKPLSSGSIYSSLRRSNIPQDYDCPLFSNNPYGDMLVALDGLASNIRVNECIDKDSKDLATKLSSDLVQQINSAQSQEQSGNIYQLGLNAKSVIYTANQLQNLLGQFATAQKDACYKDKEPRKNLIFQINDIIQNVSPLALNFVAKNPGLSDMLKSYLPSVIGGQAVSGSVSALENAINSMKTMDLTNPENQITVFKNTCSFMKIYSRFEILLLEGNEQKNRIESDFDAQIKKNNDKIKMMSSSNDRGPIQTNTEVSSLDSVINDSKDYMQKLNSAQTEVVSAKSFNPTAPELKICSTVLGTARSIDTDKMKQQFDSFSKILHKETNNEFTLRRFEGFDVQLKTFNDPRNNIEAQPCSDMALEWLSAAQEVSTELFNMLKQYAQQHQLAVGSNAVVSSTNNSLNNSQVDKLKQENQNLEDNKKQLNAFIDYTADYSAFEPSIIAKRIDQLPKYLFAGPDGNNGSWFMGVVRSVTNGVLSYFNESYGNGPVYEYLKNNEDHFNTQLHQIKNRISVLQDFEMEVLAKEYPKGPKGSSVEAKTYINKIEMYKKTFPHLEDRYLKQMPVRYEKYCEQASLIRKNYNEAVTHAISSLGMCKMIYPVLKEPDVSKWLKRYCQDSRGLLTNTTEDARYKTLFNDLMGDKGVKTYVDNIGKKLDNLNCEQFRKKNF